MIILGRQVFPTPSKEEDAKIGNTNLLKLKDADDHSRILESRAAACIPESSNFKTFIDLSIIPLE